MFLQWWEDSVLNNWTWTYHWLFQISIGFSCNNHRIFSSNISNLIHKIFHFPFNIIDKNDMQASCTEVESNFPMNKWHKLFSLSIVRCEWFFFLLFNQSYNKIMVLKSDFNNNLRHRSIEPSSVNHWIIIKRNFILNT